ncbi:hypothetical protein HK105_207900 [Polyrhizophydium stewartii]|uniref:Uncharacterized protein n=1 Tax=Polyrhizophydium stewartii TaxID=2732419 RepID=A0ABR4MZ84_9FUNG
MTATLRSTGAQTVASSAGSFASVPIVMPVPVRPVPRKHDQAFGDCDDDLRALAAAPGSAQPASASSAVYRDIELAEPPAPGPTSLAAVLAQFDAAAAARRPSIADRLLPEQLRSLPPRQGMWLNDTSSEDNDDDDDDDQGHDDGFDSDVESDLESSMPSRSRSNSILGLGGPFRASALLPQSGGGSLLESIESHFSALARDLDDLSSLSFDRSQRRRSSIAVSTASQSLYAFSNASAAASSVVWDHVPTRAVRDQWFAYPSSSSGSSDAAAASGSASGSAAVPSPRHGATGHYHSRPTSYLSIAERSEAAASLLSGFSRSRSSLLAPHPLQTSVSASHAASASSLSSHTAARRRSLSIAQGTPAPAKSGSAAVSPAAGNTALPGSGAGTGSNDAASAPGPVLSSAATTATGNCGSGGGSGGGSVASGSGSMRGSAGRTHGVSASGIRPVSDGQLVQQQHRQALASLGTPSAATAAAYAALSSMASGGVPASRLSVQVPLQSVPAGAAACGSASSSSAAAAVAAAHQQQALAQAKIQQQQQSSAFDAATLTSVATQA